MAKLTTAQPRFTLLVANLRGGSDPSRGEIGNPVKQRIGFTQQLIPQIPREGYHITDGDFKQPGIHTNQGLLTYTDSPVPVGGTATIVVVDNTFTIGTALWIGQFELLSNEDYLVGGTTALTAVALAAAIDALPGFTAPVPGASTITVTGPFGIDGNDTRLEAVFTGAVANFTLTPDDGTFDGAEPTIGPPLIIAP